MRVISSMLAVAVLAGTAAMAAEESAADKRNNLMKTQGNYMYRVLNSMVRGQMPYDQTKVDDAFEHLAKTSAEIPSLFPESSKGQVAAKGRYYTSDKAWANKADVDAHAAKLAEAIAANRSKVHSLDDLKAVYPVINKTCSGCHEQYRLRKS